MAVDWAQDAPSSEGIGDMAKFRARGDIFERRRVAKGLAVETVIRSAGISRGAWRRIVHQDKGDVSLKVLGSVATVLDIQPQEAIEWAPEEEDTDEATAG